MVKRKARNSFFETVYGGFTGIMVSHGRSNQMLHAQRTRVLFRGQGNLRMQKLVMWLKMPAFMVGLEVQQVE